MIWKVFLGHVPTETGRRLWTADGQSSQNFSPDTLYFIGFKKHYIITFRIMIIAQCVLAFLLPRVVCCDWLCLVMRF